MNQWLHSLHNFKLIQPCQKQGKRKEDQERYDQLVLIRNAGIARGEYGVENAPNLPEIIEDTYINKAKSITIAKSVLSGYKSALKLFYRDNKIDFSCPDNKIDFSSFIMYIVMILP